MIVPRMAKGTMKMIEVIEEDLEIEGGDASNVVVVEEEGTE